MLHEEKGKGKKSLAVEVGLLEFFLIYRDRQKTRAVSQLSMGAPICRVLEVGGKGTERRGEGQ